MDSYNVSYLSTFGGAGQTRVKCEDLAEWLADHPGRMITSLQPMENTLEEQQTFRDKEKKGLQNFAQSILRSL